MDFADSQNDKRSKCQDRLLLNSRETARTLGISERKLWTMTKEGEIPSLRLGRSVRYSTNALDRWIEKLQNPGNSHQMGA